MLSKLTGAAIHITFCIVCKFDSIVVRSVGYLKFIVKSIAMYVCLHGLCRQMLLFKMQDTITFVSFVLLRQCDVNFVACIFLPDGSAHECQMCEITFGGKVSNLLKIQLFIKKKINANVYKHKERLL